MEEELIKRIPDSMLQPDAVAGETWSHLDVNDVYLITRTAINENYYDIQRILNGTSTIDNASHLDNASLSKSTVETLQSSDTKVPSSKQVKDYVDLHINDEVRHTSATERQSYSSHLNNQTLHTSLEEKDYWDGKANIEDIPTKVSDLSNDSLFVTPTNIIAGANVGILRDGNNVTISSTGGSGGGGADVDNKSLTISSQAHAQIAGTENLIGDGLLDKALLVATKNGTSYDFDWEDYTLDNMATDISNKVDKIAGKVLSTNDYTNDDKTKLSGLSNTSNSISYDNTASGLTATNIKDAIDELKTLITTVSNKLVGVDKIVFGVTPPTQEEGKNIFYVDTN